MYEVLHYPPHQPYKNPHKYTDSHRVVVFPSSSSRRHPTNKNQLTSYVYVYEYNELKTNDAKALRETNL